GRVAQRRQADQEGGREDQRHGGRGLHDRVQRPAAGAQAVPLGNRVDGVLGGEPPLGYLHAGAVVVDPPGRADPDGPLLWHLNGALGRVHQEAPLGSWRAAAEFARHPVAAGCRSAVATHRRRITDIERSATWTREEPLTAMWHIATGRAVKCPVDVGSGGLNEWVHGDFELGRAAGLDRPISGTTRYNRVNAAGGVADAGAHAPNAATGAVDNAASGASADGQRVRVAPRAPGPRAAAPRPAAPRPAAAPPPRRRPVPAAAAARPVPGTARQPRC